MPNRWIEFVKKWAKDNNTSYGCALTKPEMKAEYHYRYPKVKTKGVAKLEESRPPVDVKSKVTYPNLTIRIPPQQEQEEQDNIQFDIEEMGAEEPARRRRGRPQVHMTAEEQYKAKLESNKQKRRERAAAKKVRGGMIPAESDSDSKDAEHRGVIEHMGANIKNLTKEKGDAKEIQEEQFDLATNAFLRLKALKNPTPQESAILNLGKSRIDGFFMDCVMDLPSYYRTIREENNPKIMIKQPSYK